MAVGDIRLTTNRYIRPGTYIGRVHQPRPSSLTGTPRFPCAIGRGSRLAREQDSRHIRAYVYAETLNFSPAPPYFASLDHNASNDQGLARLYKSTGDEVTIDKWAFYETTTGSGEYDRVIIIDTAFDKNASYLIEYQSVDDDVLDELQFDDLRGVLYVGDSSGVSRYTEFEDYRINTTLTGDSTDTDALVAATTNTYTDGAVSAITETPAGASLATLTFDATTDYVFPYNRTYTLTAQNAGGADPNRTIEFKVEVTATSGGNSQTTNLPFFSTADAPVLAIQQGVNDTNIALDDNTFYKVGYKLPTWWPDDGIVLDITWNGVANFDDGDVFTWTASGPGLMEFSSAHQNTNQFSDVEDPVAGAYNSVTPANVFSSGGSITISSETDYNDEFDRQYTLVATNAAGVGPNRTVDIQWAAHNELPFSEGSFTLTEATATSLTNVLLEKKIYLNFAFGADHNVADTTNTLTGTATSLASALSLASTFMTKYNAHDNNDGGVWHIAGTPAHAFTVAAPIDLETLRTWALDAQTKLLAHWADTTQHWVADTTHDFTYTVTATSSLGDILAWLNDAIVQYNKHRVASGFIDGDYWTINARADRREYTAKDDRNYLVTINTINAGVSVQLTYNANNYEGGWGVLTATATDGSYLDPYVDLPDNLRLMLRNVDSRYAANDKHSFSVTCDDTMDWTLVRRASETIDDGDVQFDGPGTITGVPLTYYIILNETPTAILRVKQALAGTPLSYTWVTNTPYIYFATDPAVDIQVDYEWAGYEPNAGESYFVTANRKRDDNEFNEPIRYLDRDSARLGLYPSATSNHLWLAAEIMFDTSFFGGYFIQVKSAGDNEVYTIADYRNAIDASETKSDISDIIVLSYFNALGYAKLSVEQMCDPFEGKQRLLWVGVPSGTAIGDDTTPGTIVYLARKTLQFGPNSQGKGNVILMANNTLTRTQQMEDGSTTTLALDGSFLAAHAAALTASFNDPASTILKQQVASFDSITLFTESETKILGAASTVYMNTLGSSIYEYGESRTVDTTEVALNEISARTQEHYVLKQIRTELNNLIGFVPPSPAAGVLLIQSNLVLILGGMASSGIVAPYGSEQNPPTIRPINPNRDVYVFADPLDQRTYHFGYYFNTRLPIKNILGLYSVNTRFWDARDLNAA